MAVSFGGDDPARGLAPVVAKPTSRNQ